MMSDIEFIGYCEVHAETPRALFKGSQVNRMIALAGYPSGYIPQPEDAWISVKEPMLELAKLARAELRRATFTVIEGGKQ